MKGCLVILMLALLCSCTATKYVPVESVRTEYRDHDVLRVDSVMLHDSVVIRSAGDTVLMEKWRWRDRVSIVRDTVSVTKTDSIQVPYPVEKQLTRWERAKMDFGGIAIGACAATLILAAIGIARNIRQRLRWHNI